MSIFNSLGSNYNFSFVLKSLFSLYGDTRDLEKLLEEKYGGKAILLYQGREAIELALKTLNLSEGSFVAINGFTCFAVYDAVKNAGFNVEYLDIGRGELNFSAGTLEQAIGKNSEIKVVIIQNTLGYPCDIERISSICKKNNLILIEDLAHSVGTKYDSGEESGTVGDITIFSFSQDKMIDGISGGALISHDSIEPDFKSLPISQQVIDKVYPLFTFTIRRTYPIKIGKIIHFVLKKLNFLSNPMKNMNGFHNLPAWYSKLIFQQFEKLDDNLNHRKTIASIYAKSINPKILSPKIIDEIHLSSNLRFPIFVENRQGLIKFLEDNRLFISDIWYDAPIAPKKYLQFTNYSGQCPNAELASAEIVNLPTHMNVSEIDAQNLSQLINQWLQSR